MNIEDLKKVVKKSREVFKKIKEKYPDLSGDLVFSSPFGQCKLTTDMAEILNSFPQMIVDCKQQEKGLELLQKITEIESGNKKSDYKAKSFEKFKLELSEVINKLEVKEDTFVEIRFDKTGLLLIFELQKDELISQEHTPQTKASIRIVLGMLKDLK